MFQWISKPLQIKHLLLLFCSIFLLGAGTGGVFYYDHGLLDKYFDIKGSSAPAKSSSGQGRIYADSTTNGAMISNNTGQYYSVQTNRNMIINPDMLIAQRGSQQNLAATAYVADHWKCVIATANSGTYGLTAVNTKAVIPSGSYVQQVPHYGGVICNNNNSAVSAGSVVLLQQTIEANELTSDIMDQGMTLSFLAKADTTYTFGISIQNPDATKSVMQTFTVGTTLQQFVFTFPPPASSELSNSGTSAGLELDICLVAGSNYQGTASSTWDGTLYNGGTGGVAEYTTSSQSNFGAVTNNSFYIGAVQLEPGQQATTYRMRPYQQELAMCQRYCYVIDGTGATAVLASGGLVVATNQITYNFHFPVRMRIMPTRTATAGDWSATDGSASATINSITATSSSTCSEMNAYIGFSQGGTTWTVGHSAVILSTGVSKKFIFDADF